MVTTGNTSLVGPRIESDDANKPIGVFSGHECAWIPEGVTACDHIEDQLSEVTLDGVAIDDAAFIDAGGGYEVARVAAADGVHALDSTQGFMVMVVGFDDADSYAYVGGTGTGVINPNPEG